MEKLTAKSSTIFIATGEATRVYRSVRDIPPALRRRLEESTNGTNSATILIADKRGREELVRVLQGLPSDVQSRLAHTLRANQPAQTQGSRKSSRRRQLLRRWLEILAPVVVGLSVWFLASSH
jgi:hypothetical protein